MTEISPYMDKEVNEWLPGVMVPRYGNEPTVDVCYHAAAILITVPEWSSKRSALAIQ